jgi:hypothetical protein
MKTRVVREPGKQRPRSATRDRLELVVAELDTKRADESNAEHLGGSLLAAAARNPVPDPRENARR